MFGLEDWKKVIAFVRSVAPAMIRLYLSGDHNLKDYMSVAEKAKADQAAKDALGDLKAPVAVTK